MDAVAHHDVFRRRIFIDSALDDDGLAFGGHRARRQVLCREIKAGVAVKPQRAQRRDRPQQQPLAIFGGNEIGNTLTAIAGHPWRIAADGIDELSVEKQQAVGVAVNLFLGNEVGIKTCR